MPRAAAVLFRSLRRSNRAGTQLTIWPPLPTESSFPFRILPLAGETFCHLLGSSLTSSAPFRAALTEAVDSVCTGTGFVLESLRLEPRRETSIRRSLLDTTFKGRIPWVPFIIRSLSPELSDTSPARMEYAPAPGRSLFRWCQP